MHQKVNDQIEVLASFRVKNKAANQVIPHAIRWHGRKYAIDHFGLYHREKRGKNYYHIFSFSSGDTAFRIELDPETLAWKLTEVYHEP